MEFRQRHNRNQESLQYTATCKVWYNKKIPEFTNLKCSCFSPQLHISSYSFTNFTIIIFVLISHICFVFFAHSTFYVSKILFLKTISKRAVVHFWVRHLGRLDLLTCLQSRTLIDCCRMWISIDWELLCFVMWWAWLNYYSQSSKPDILHVLF